MLGEDEVQRRMKPPETVRFYGDELFSLTVRIFGGVGVQICHCAYSFSSPRNIFDYIYFKNVKFHHLVAYIMGQKNRNEELNPDLLQ